MAEMTFPRQICCKMELTADSRGLTTCSIPMVDISEFGDIDSTGHPHQPVNGLYNFNLRVDDRVDSRCRLAKIIVIPIIIRIAKAGQFFSGRGNDIGHQVGFIAVGNSKQYFSGMQDGGGC